MSASYLIFDFAGNDEAAQQACQRIENWQRGFRLGNKLMFHFDRTGAEQKAERAAGIQLIVRVDFSDHEKLSRQRWLDRIPADELFKSAKLSKVSPGDAAYAETEAKFSDTPSGVPAKKH